MAWAVTWSEIAQFPVYWGTAPNVIREQRISNFACGYTEWRIVWNYTPISIVDPENVYFNILIYRTNDTVYYVMDMHQQGNTTTNGAMYINSQPGEFFLKFLVYNVLDSTAVIEQDAESLPEFSSIFLLPLLMAGSLVAVIVARKDMRLLSHGQS